MSRLAEFVSFVDLPASMVLETLKSDWADYEDALQHASALNNNVDCIVTRNKKDFKDSSLPIYTPEELLENLIKQNDGPTS